MKRSIIAVVIAAAALAAGWYGRQVWVYEVGLRQAAAFVAAVCSDPDIEVAQESDACQRYMAMGGE